VRGLTDAVETVLTLMVVLLLCAVAGVLLAIYIISGVVAGDYK